MVQREAAWRLMAQEGAEIGPPLGITLQRMGTLRKVRAVSPGPSAPSPGGFHHPGSPHPAGTGLGQRSLLAHLRPGFLRPAAEDPGEQLDHRLAALPGGGGGEARLFGPCLEPLARRS